MSDFLLCLFIIYYRSSIFSLTCAAFFVFLVFHPSVLFALPLFPVCVYSCMGRDEKNWNHRAVTQVGFSLIRM